MKCQEITKGVKALDPVPTQPCHPLSSQCSSSALLTYLVCQHILPLVRGDDRGGLVGVCILRLLVLAGGLGDDFADKVGNLLRQHLLAKGDKGGGAKAVSKARSYGAYLNHDRSGGHGCKDVTLQ